MVTRHAEPEARRDAARISPSESLNNATGHASGAMPRPEDDPELESVVRRRSPGPSSIATGSLWMVGISVLLFWLPTIGGVVAGVVGGYRVGTIRRALLAAVIPSGVVGLVVWLFVAAAGMPLLGTFAGIALATVVMISMAGLFFGAIIGGWLADQPPRD